MNKKILFIVPMVALVLAGCNKRGESTTSADPSATTATSGATSTTQTVIPVEKVYVDSWTVKVNIGETAQVQAHVVPENATDKGLLYESLDQSIFTVTDAGVVTGVKAGSAKCKVTAHGDNTKSQEVTVKVSDPSYAFPSTTADGFSLLVSGDSLKEDDKIYFSGLEGTTLYTMQQYASGNFVPCAAGTVNENVLTVGEAAEKYTIEEGTGGVYFKDSKSNYLYAAGGSSNNYLKADAEKKETSLFAVTSDESGISSVETAGCERGSMRFNYNNGNPRFASYSPASELQKVNIYVKHSTRVLQSIEISGTPKTSYIKGSAFEAPTVMANFNEGDPVDVTSQTTFSGYDLSTAGTYTVTASYTFKEVTKTTTYDITVVDDVLETITVGGDMTKKSYFVDDAWDPTGLTFTGHYTTAGDVDISSNPGLALSYNPATATDTSVNSVEVTATLDGVAGSKTVTGITVTAKSSMQIAYEAAIAAGGTASEESYTFTGVVTGFMSTTRGFYVQDGAYAMFVFMAKPTDLDVGKNVTVTSKVMCYGSNLPETTGTPTVVVNGDDTPATPVEVTSQAGINSLKINTAVKTTAVLTADFLTQVAAWNSSTTKNPKLTVGSDSITMNFDKNSANELTALKNAFAAFSAGTKVDITNAVVRCYNGANQFGAMSTTTVAVSSDPATSITCVASESEVQIGSSITLSAQFNGSHTADATFDITEGKGTYASITGNEVTGVAEGTIKVKAYCTDPVLESEEISISVIPASKLTLTRVTASSQIVSGDEYILGYEADSTNKGVIVPMRAEGTATTSAAGFIRSGTTAESSTNSTINTSTLASADAYKITIVESTSVKGDYCFKIGSNFIGNTNTKNNCKLFEAESANTAFNLTFGENDVVTAKISANETYHTFQYNTGNPRFAVYGGTQQGFVLYHVSVE